METLSIFNRGKVRRETLNGVEYLVAPMTMIVPGILNGSNGPILYTENENHKSVDAWNGMPITLYHPTEGDVPVSARNPKILNKQGIGFVFGASVVNGSLKAEAWIDVAKTTALNGSVVNRMLDGEAVELSTGLKVELEQTNNSDDYKFIARNYAPDHLAILPDQVGACSLKDGCGLMVNKCKCVGTCENCKKILNEQSLSETEKKAYRAISERFGDQAYTISVFPSRIIYSVNEEMFEIGYSKTEDEVVLSSEEPQKVKRIVDFVPIANEEIKTQMANKELVAQVIANCSCWSEKDAEVLNGLADEKLQGFLDAEKQATENQLLVANLQKQQTENEETEVQDDTESTPDTSVETQNAKSRDQQLAELPPVLRSVVENALRVENKARQELIEQITANLEGEAKTKVANRLQNKDLEELEDLVVLAENKQVQTNNQSVTSYFGASGAPIANQGSGIDKKSMLEAMTPPSSFVSSD